MQKVGATAIETRDFTKEAPGVFMVLKHPPLNEAAEIARSFCLLCRTAAYLCAIAAR